MQEIIPVIRLQVDRQQQDKQCQKNRPQSTCSTCCRCHQIAFTGERGPKYSPRASAEGIEITRTELSAEPEITRSEQGLKRKDVTGKSCARRMVMIDFGESNLVSAARLHQGDQDVPAG